MSDDEYERMSNTSQTSMKGDEAFAKRKAGLHKNELNEQLKEYITQWRDERSKEVSKTSLLGSLTDSSPLSLSGGGTQETEGQTGQEERDPSRAGEGAGQEEARGGGAGEEGRGREEGR